MRDGLGKQVSLTHLRTAFKIRYHTNWGGGRGGGFESVNNKDRKLCAYTFIEFILEQSFFEMFCSGFNCGI